MPLSRVNLHSQTKLTTDDKMMRGHAQPNPIAVNTSLRPASSSPHTLADQLALPPSPSVTCSHPMPAQDIAKCSLRLTIHIRFSHSRWLSARRPFAPAARQGPGGPFTPVSAQAVSPKPSWPLQVSTLALARLCARLAAFSTMLSDCAPQQCPPSADGGTVPRGAGGSTWYETGDCSSPKTSMQYGCPGDE